MAFGYAIRELPYRDWRDRLTRTIEPDSPAYSVLPLIPEQPAPEGARHPSIDCSRAEAALAGSGITCAPLDERLVHLQLRYLVGIGFLKPPDRAARPGLTASTPVRS